MHPAVVCGDFNAHSLSWDAYQPESALGEAIEDWATDNGLTILNDGGHTRQNPRYHWNLGARCLAGLYDSLEVAGRHLGDATGTRL